MRLFAHMQPFLHQHKAAGFLANEFMNAIPDNQVDLSDIPEITDFSKGHFRNRKPIKKPVTVRIDDDES